MLTLQKPISSSRPKDRSWIGPAPWIICPPPGPETSWAISREEHAGLPTVHRPFPLVIKRAQGTIIEDLDGNRYLDFTAGLGMCSIGHCHPQVLRAVEKQAGQLLHVGGEGFSHRAIVLLREKLASLMPGGDYHTLTAPTPEQILSLGVRMARQATGRKLVLTFRGAERGWSGVRVYNTSTAKAYRKQIIGSRTRELPYGDLAAIQTAIDSHQIKPDEMAAIVVSPFNLDGGCQLPPADFLPGLRALCDRHGIILIMDELQVGIGRSGRFFGCQHTDTQPDILLIHQGLGSGMPIAALMARHSVMQRLDMAALQLPPAADAVACAAAVATLEALQAHLLEHAVELHDTAMSKLHRIAEKHRCLQTRPGMGMILGLDVLRGRGASRRVVQLRDRIITEAFARGLLLLGSGNNGLRIEPPLSINRVQLEVAFEVFDEAVSTVIN